MKTLIVCADKDVDGLGSIQVCLNLENQLRELDEAPLELVIDPLSTDWHSAEKVNHFRSGCGPIEALARAKTLIEDGHSAVVIRGEDAIKSAYSREERLSKMAIYGKEYPLTEAYTDLAEQFIERHRITETEFKNIAESLFNNYLKSYELALGESFHPDLLPSSKWYNSITRLFRGVDCANPMVDFSGRILVCNDETADKLEIPQEARTQIHAVGLGRTQGDGRDFIDKIVTYAHLKQAFDQCANQSSLKITEQLNSKNLLLDAYTCYPVVPMAFLLCIGAVKSIRDIPEFLEHQQITVTGGMNLARGAWNCPALNGLIDMHHRLLKSEQNYGLVHGNGGLGYRQGLALLSQVS